jgi:hypothetical protein
MIKVEAGKVVEYTSEAEIEEREGEELAVDGDVEQPEAIEGVDVEKMAEETIKKIAYAFARSKNADKINYEHDMESMVDDVYVAESWIIDESKTDKSNVFGYDLPKGTWFGLFKIDNEDFWNDYIKNGKVKGVSVEGYFVNKLTKLV